MSGDLIQYEHLHEGLFERFVQVLVLVYKNAVSHWGLQYFSARQPWHCRFFSEASGSPKPRFSEVAYALDSNLGKTNLASSNLSGSGLQVVYHNGEE
jgi:hypothetical protein